MWNMKTGSAMEMKMRQSHAKAWMSPDTAPFVRMDGQSSLKLSCGFVSQMIACSAKRVSGRYTDASRRKPYLMSSTFFLFSSLRSCQEANSWPSRTSRAWPTCFPMV